MKRRSSGAARELSLVAFTMLAQAGAGALLLLVLPAVMAGAGPDRRPGVVEPSVGVLLLLGFAAALSILHLGKPSNAPRTLANLGTSWLSREILFLGASAGLVAVVLVLEWTRTGGRGGLVGAAAAAGLAGALLVLSMANIYRLEAVPVWRGPMTPFAFFMTATLAGTLTVAGAPGRWGPHPLSLWIAPLVAGLLVVDLLAVTFADPSFGLRRMPRCLAEREVPRGLVLVFGLRLALLLASAGAAATVALLGAPAAVLLVPPLVAGLVSETLGRVLFYATFRKAGL